MITSHQIEEMYQPSVDWLKTQGYSESLIDYKLASLSYWEKASSDYFEEFIFDNRQTVFIYNCTDYNNDDDLSRTERHNVIYYDSEGCLKNVKFYSL